MIRAWIATFAVLICVLCSACASQKPKLSPLDVFSQTQAKKLAYKEIFEDANFLFSATVYKPTSDDIAAMKQAWYEYGNTYPESTNMKKIETEVTRDGNLVFIVALFVTEYDTANLKDKSMGWAVGPTPISITELDERDAPLRTLMPIKNDWARYFMVKYNRDFPVKSLVVSNRAAKVEIPVSN